MENKSVPIRKCIGCGARKAKDEFGFRINIHPVIKHDDYFKILPADLQVT